MRKSKKTIVYWAPVWDLLEDPIDWNMLYPEPECLLSVMLRDKVQRPGRNPKTGEEVEISARRVVTFHASQKLKEKIQIKSTIE